MFLIFCQKFLCSESVPSKTILNNNDWHNITGQSSNQFNSLGSCRCRLVVLSTPKSSSYQGFPQIEHERGIQYSHIMERYSINRIYIFHSFFFDSVALKGIFLFLNFRAWVKVFHSYSALNRAQHIPCDTKGHRKVLLVIQCDYMQLSVQKGLSLSKWYSSFVQMHSFNCMTILLITPTNTLPGETEPSLNN